MESRSGGQTGVHANHEKAEHPLSRSQPKPRLASHWNAKPKRSNRSTHVTPRSRASKIRARSDLGHEHARRVRTRGATRRVRPADVARRGRAPHVVAPAADALVHLGVGDLVHPAARVAHLRPPLPPRGSETYGNERRSGCVAAAIAAEREERRGEVESELQARYGAT